jgi:thiamine-monophosphate kinase
MSLSEFEIIEKYFRNLANLAPGVCCGIGDDAAVVEVPAGHELLVSVDTLVSGIHFPVATDPADIGYKSLAVNLSDMAAMAARPQWITLALTLPEYDQDWLEGFCRGFAELANQFEVSLIGGDMTHGPLSITIQVMGVTAIGTSVRRTGARPGDLIYVSGCLGGAGHALQKLHAGSYAGGTDDLSMQRLFRPFPRVATGIRLQGIASAAIDISDGLAADLGHLLQSSSVGAQIRLSQIPVCAGVDEIRDESAYWNTVLCSGDDYELCFTVPQKKTGLLEEVMTGMDCAISCIGTIESGRELVWSRNDGSEYQLQDSSYRHF